VEKFGEGPPGRNVLKRTKQDQVSKNDGFSKGGQAKRLPSCVFTVSAMGFSAARKRHRIMYLALCAQ